MIEGIEPIYQRIANSMVDAIPDQWNAAKIEAVFYSDSSDYMGEYLTDSGKVRSFEITTELSRAFREMRRKFKESSNSVWGQVSFELQSDGKFDLKWGYDNCDANGDTIWDEKEYHRRSEEYRLRVTEP